MKKPKLYCLLGTNRTLEPTGGDKINEARFLRSASSYFDVYYNNVLYVNGCEEFGHPGVGVSPPSQEYDLYYVRNNRDILLQCGAPCVTMAVPYDAEVFDRVDGLIVTTQTWRDLLLKRDEDDEARAILKDWYGDGSNLIRKPVFYVGQAYDPGFRQPMPRRTLRFRHSFSNGDAIGYFGRIAPSTMPTIAMTAVMDVARFSPQLQFIYGGFVRKPVTSRIGLQVPPIAYGDMPAAIAACTAVVGNEEKDADFLGSGKIIDAMAVGTPVLAKLNPVRLEQLGEDYPLFYRDRWEAALKLHELVTGGLAFRQAVTDFMAKRLEHHHPDEVGRRLYEAWLTL